MRFSCGTDAKIIQHLICLLVWCQAVETELIKLGQNVTINCDLGEKEIYWMVLKPPNRPVVILRIFSTSPTPFYYDIGFRPKYTVQPKYSLFIKNVTVDELGIYYCMTTEAPPKFSNGTKLHIIEPTQLIECQNNTVEQNHTVVNYTEQIQRPWGIIILISGLMHGLLVIVVIASVCCYSGKNVKHQEADLQRTRSMPFEQLQETKTVYTEVVFSSICEDFEQNRCFSAPAQIIKRQNCT
ncbi:hypothetical protein F2P79_017115 [Pimephales promelas]|nr:hypothetical protein F2P79_017115 [Pimephales promelas]